MPTLTPPRAQRKPPALVKPAKLVKPAERLDRAQRSVQSIEVGGPLLLALSQSPAPMSLKDLAAAAAYGTSKGALIHLTKQQACELGDVGVRVNAVAPGPVETEMAKQVHDDTIRRDYFDAIPLKRYGTVQEIAAAVGFLCSKEAGFINGQVLAVDGGFDASGVGLAGLRRSRGSAA